MAIWNFPKLELPLNHPFQGFLWFNKRSSYWSTPMTMDPPLNTIKHHVLSPLNTAQLGDLAETGGSFCFFRTSWTPRSETFLGATANWALKDLWNNVIQLIFIQTIYIM